MSTLAPAALREYAEQWRAAQVHRPTTRAHVETHLRRRAYPVLGDRPLSSVRPSDIQAWTAGLAAAIAPRTTGRVDFLRRVVTVDQQLVTVPGLEPFLAPPKTSASVRTVPLPQAVLDALAAHLAAYPAAGLVFANEHGRPIRPTAFGSTWRAAGAPHGTGFHDLRHFYASLLIRHGEKVVQARLGHASAAETLDTYSHLWPDSDDRTRAAVDAVLLADSARTEGVRL